MGFVIADAYVAPVTRMRREGLQADVSADPKSVILSCRREPVRTGSPCGHKAGDVPPGCKLQAHGLALRLHYWLGCRKKVPRP